MEEACSRHRLLKLFTILCAFKYLKINNKLDAGEYLKFLILNKIFAWLRTGRVNLYLDLVCLSLRMSPDSGAVHAWPSHLVRGQVQGGGVGHWGVAGVRGVVKEAAIGCQLAIWFLYKCIVPNIISSFYPGIWRVKYRPKPQPSWHQRHHHHDEPR